MLRLIIIQWNNRILEFIKKSNRILSGIALCFKVAAVVHMPFGAHPSAIAGYYDSDYAFQAKALRGVMRDTGRFQAYLDEWVHGCPDHDAYLAHYRERFGADALDGIRATRGPDAGHGVRYTYNPDLRFQ